MLAAILIAAATLIAAGTRTTKIYLTDGGDSQVVGSGGTVTVESGGTVDQQTGSVWKVRGTTVTATGADLNTIAGGITYTNSATFEIDKDSEAAKITLDTNSATGDFTLKLVPTNLTGDRTISFPNSTGTVMVSAYTDLDLGDASNAGTLDIFTGDGTGRKMIFDPADTGANSRTITITNEAIAASRSYKIPDAGGDGQFVMTNADQTCVITTGAADRSITLGGDVSLAGGLTTAADLTFSGANACVISVPSASTWALPTGGGTLALATGAESGTHAPTFTVDDDAATTRFSLSGNTGGGTEVCTLKPATHAAARTITLPYATGATDTLALLGTPNIFTGALDLRGAVSSGGSNPAFDLSGSSGAFKTTTGAVTIGNGAIGITGDVTIAAAKGITTAGAGAGAFDFSAQTGIFSTSTGANTLGGDVTIAAGKQLDIGTALGGDATPLRLFSATAANGLLVVKCQNDADDNTTTLQSGNPGAAANPTITLPVATSTLATIGLSEALDLKSLTNAGNITQTGATGVVTGTGGLETLSADSSFIVDATASGNAAFDVTVTNAVHGQASVYKIPDSGAATAQVVVTTGDNAVKVNANGSDRTVSLSGNLTTAAGLTTTTAAVTLAANAAGSNVTLPASGTLATTGNTETLAAKTIDGDDNTIQDLGPGAAKVAVEGTSAPVTAVPAIPFVVSYQTPEAAGTYDIYTVPTGKKLRVISIGGYKITQAGGAAGTLTVINSGTTNAISDGISMNIGDKAVFAASTFDDAERDLAAAAKLQVTTATAAACKLEAVLNITCVWVTP